MQLTFKINFENDSIVVVDSIMQKPCGLVVVGIIENGNISKGDPVSIQVDGKETIHDQIKRIEVYHKEVTTAISGQLIGLCLTKTSKEKLLQYLGRN